MKKGGGDGKEFGEALDDAEDGGAEQVHRDERGTGGDMGKMEARLSGVGQAATTRSAT